MKEQNPKTREELREASMEEHAKMYCPELHGKCITEKCMSFRDDGNRLICEHYHHCAEYYDEYWHIPLL